MGIEMDERSLFDGDQDYGSAVGWDPNKAWRDRLIEDTKKKYPRSFSPQPDMIYVRSIDDCMEIGSRVAMKQLFGPLWLEEELAIVFSSPGVGKSALAVQIAEGLARGFSLAPFDRPSPGCEVPPKRVLYLDFELTLQQFARRYSTMTEDAMTIENPYKFSQNFIRGDVFWNGQLIDGYEDFTDMLFTDIENTLDQHEAQVLVCDNITFLSESSTSSGNVAFRLMNQLQHLKKDRFISILAVAHAPKRDAHLPLTQRDLQGSIDIAKVADSIFAIGASAAGTDIRYIKHIKSRSGRIDHGAANVLTYRLGKFDLARTTRPDEDTVRADNFFGYSFLGCEDELRHLEPRFRPMPAKRPPKLNLSMVKKAKALSREGLSLAAIAEKLGVARATAQRYVGKGVSLRSAA